MSRSWDTNLIAFRVLAEADLDLLIDWLRLPHVQTWWGEEYADATYVDAEFRPMLGGQSPTLGMIAEYEGAPVAYIQRYFPRDWPEYWGHQGFPDATAGIDVTIGDAAFLHKGFGPVMIREFLDRIVFDDGTIDRCIIDPDPENHAAIRAYAKIGFSYLRTIAPPEHCETAYLMVLERNGPA